MFSSVTVMWIMLSSGPVITREYPTLADCLSTSQILQFDAYLRGDRRFERVICIEEDARAHPTFVAPLAVVPAARPTFFPPAAVAPVPEAK